MGITAININKIIEYIPKCDRESENPTVFHLGFINADLWADIMDEVTEFHAGSGSETKMAKTTLKLNRSKIELLRFGIKNISGLINPETKKEMKFDTIPKLRNGKSCNVIREDLLFSIPAGIRDEIVEEIERLNTLGEAEAKN